MPTDVGDLNYYLLLQGVKGYYTKDKGLLPLKQIFKGGVLDNDQ